MGASEPKIIDKDELFRIAALAGMDIPEDEVETLINELNSVLVHVNRLEAFNTDQVEPLILPVETICPVRQDIPGLTLEQSHVTGQAPMSDGEHILVPGVISQV